MILDSARMPVGRYDEHVFINCPFDLKHAPLLRAMVFAVHDCGFIARSALETEDAGEVRIRKIMQIMRESKYGIHDISRIELDRGTRLPRFNMPLELGIFLGAKEFGRREQREKVCLILDRERFRYQAFCSDIAGQDIRAHLGDPGTTVRVVRNFLANQRPHLLFPSGEVMSERYARFATHLTVTARKNRIDMRDMTFNEVRTFVTLFLRANPP